MGGISTGVNAGIDQFKKLFGGRIVNEYTYLCSGLPYLSRMFLKLLKEGLTLITASFIHF